MGEIATDDGATVRLIDLAGVPDSVTILSTDPPVLRTQKFELPASGSLSYYPWAIASSDSLVRISNDTFRYRLTFLDTSDSRLALDSIELHDTIGKVRGATRSVALSFSGSHYGRLEFMRSKGRLLTDSARWGEILTLGRLSGESSGKKGFGRTAVGDDIRLAAVPNPLKDQTSITFSLPTAGAVTLEVLNALGMRVTTLAHRRIFHAGTHKLVWSTHDLPSGIYVAALRYGNTTKTLSMSVLK